LDLSYKKQVKEQKIKPPLLVEKDSKKKYKILKNIKQKILVRQTKILG